jgi:Protein of unknown function (DUF2934)
MSLVHYVRPFLELGICKEYAMARKTTGITTTSRSKKTIVTPPSPVQAATEVLQEVPKQEAPKARNNGKGTNVFAINNVVPINIEEQIRRRAYELYLERRATADSGKGDENQDWLLAEREILSRGREQHTA